jgi:hypothetical protein
VIFTVNDGTDTNSVTINWDAVLAPVPTTTTSTTIASTTTTTTLVAPTTIPDTSPPTTAPSTEPTEALPFSNFQANDDEIVVTAAERIVIDVRSNDVGGENARIVALSVPEFGELDVVDNQLILDMPAGFVGQFTFLYSVENPQGEVSSAAVKVFAASTVAISPIDLASAPVANASDVLRRFGSLVLQILRIDLSSLQIGAIFFAPIMFLLLRAVFDRRDQLVAINSISLAGGADAKGEDGEFHLRHDATVWKQKRAKRQVDGVNQVQIETPDGMAWINADLVIDTGH